MHIKHLRPMLLLIAAFAQATLLAQSPDTETPEETVVSGPQPGPPLWKVSDNEHVLWILPVIDFYPKEMEWESTKVENLIKGSQEFLGLPHGMHLTELSHAMNPLTLVSAYNLYKKSTRLPKGQTLADVLPPELYQRFIGLKALYFPDNNAIEKLGPREAGKAMQQEIMDHENLEMLNRQNFSSPQLVTDKIGKWLKSNKAIRLADTNYVVDEKVSVEELETEIGEWQKNPDFMELQLECLERNITYFESDLAPIKRRANAWAQGSMDDLVSPIARRYENDTCNKQSAEDDLAIEKARRDKWLTAAAAALSNNTQSFALLAINDILGEHSLVARLQAQGYIVEVSEK